MPACVETRRRVDAATVEIDAGAISHNARLIASRLRGGMMAVVKADGYGHGAATVAAAALAAGAERLGVTSLDEARALRADPRFDGVPILSWLNGVDADFGWATAQRVEVAVADREHLRAVEEGARAVRLDRRAPAVVHLHLDVGMSRDGCAPSQWPRLCASTRQAEVRGSVCVVGIMGHMGCAAHPDDPANARARARFESGVLVARRAGLAPSLLHLAATAAALTDPSSHLDLCRVGAGLVGIDPSYTTRLRTAMTLRAPLVAVRSVRAGAAVGYDRGFVASRPMRLGLVPVGYADGVPRGVMGRAEVLVGGVRRMIVGAISMDQIVVDLTDAPARMGDIVTLFGPGDDGEPTLLDWAGWARTIEHEIVTGLGARVRRSVSSQRGAW
jgi:alanine racemase